MPGIFNPPVIFAISEEAISAIADSLIDTAIIKSCNISMSSD